MPRCGPQAVVFECLRQLTLTLAPMIPFVADDVYQHSVELMGRRLSNDPFVNPEVLSTVFDARWPAVNPAWANEEVSQRWSHVLELHSKVVMIVYVQSFS